MENNTTKKKPVRKAKPEAVVEPKTTVKLKTPTRLKQEENLKKGVKTQFKAGEEQVRIARKGGIASQKVQREKRTARELLQIAMSYKPVLTPALKRNLELLGADPNAGEYTAAAITMLSLQNKAMQGDVRATQLWLEISGQDPRVLLEQNRLAMEMENAKHQPGFSALDDAFGRLSPESESEQS